MSKHYQFPENDLYAENEQKEHPIYSFMDIMKQHKTRYYITLSNGESVVLKYLTKRDNDRILAYTQLLYPEYMNVYQKYNSVISSINEEMNAKTEKDFNELANLMVESAKSIIHLRPIIELMSIGVIEQPHLWDADSVRAFYDGMSPDDVELVYQAVSNLSSCIPMKHISFDEYWIAQKLGVKVVDEECIKNFTLTQAEAIAEITRQEKIEYERQMARVRKAGDI